MLRIFFVFLVLFSFSSSFLASQTDSVQSPPPKVNTSIVINEPFVKDVFIRNSQNVYSYTIQIDTNLYTIDSLSFEIIFQNSSVTLAQSSFFNIKLNGNDLSTRYADAPQPAAQSWMVTVPVQYLINGYNTFQFTAFLRTNEDPCFDFYNSLDWLKISNKSRFILKRTIKNNLSLLSYPFPFVDNLANFPVQTNFVLPDYNSVSSIDAYLKFTSSMYQFIPYDKSVSFGISKAAAPDKNNILFEAANGTAVVKTLNVNPGAGQGILYFVPSENNTYNLYISGTDAEGLKKSIYALSNRSSINELNQNPAIVTNLTNTQNTLVPDIPSDITAAKFADIGISNINIKGLFEQRGAIKIIKPVGFQAGFGTNLKIKFSHSANLRKHTSMLSVLVNSQYAGGRNFNESYSDIDSMIVYIPQEELKKNIWTIEFVAYNDLIVDKGECNKRYYDEIWTTISNESVLNLQSGDINYIPTLESFPMVLPSLNRSYANISVWLPENPDESMLQLLGMITYQASRRSGVPLNIKTFNSANVTDDIKKSDIIIKLSSDGSAGYDEIKDKMIVAPAGNGTFKVKDGFNITTNELKNTAFIEAITSPWSENGVIYSIILNGANISSIINSINSEETTNLSGSLTIVNNGVRVINLSEQQKVTIVGETGNFFLQNLRWIILGIFIAIVILFWYLKKLKNRRILKNNETNT